MDYQHYTVDPVSTNTFQPYPFSNFHRHSDASLHTLLPTDETGLFGQLHWNGSMNLYQPNLECEESNQPERGIAGFVSKLYQCLQAPDDGQKYARWCRHNGIDMFIIDCIPKFTEIVLPRLFKHCKFASFVRQLNIYGFQRDTDARKSKDSKDKETCRWHHIHFRPGRRDLFHLIRRKTPRYSRRKRQKVEDDTETVINTVSGDESNNDEESSQSQRRASASSVSSSTTLQQVTEYKPQSLHMLFESPQQMEITQQQHNQQHQHEYMHQTLRRQISAHIPSSSEEPCHFSHLLESVNETDCLDESESPHDLAMHQTMTQEEELRSQIAQLRRGYTKMYKILTGEVNKAVSLIDVQRSRIEFLETSLRNVKLKSQGNTPNSFIDSSNYFSPEYIVDQSTANGTEVHTPTTPIHPATQIRNNVFLPRSPSPKVARSHAYDLYFSSPSHDEDLKQPPQQCQSNKGIWLSTFQNETTMCSEVNLEDTSGFNSNSYTSQSIGSPIKQTHLLSCEVPESNQ